MTVLTAVSRVTGFVRILVVAAVLGTTFLGNTYQSANTVPNLLFELAAAGALQAVLVPTFVSLVDSGDRAEAEHVAGSVLGIAAVVLAALALLGALAAPWVMRALVVAVDDPAVREAQVRLGTFFLWFFLPQVVLYALGMVSTAVLHAHQRFAVPAAAPIVNNVVVIAAYVVFALLRDGRPPTLDLRTVEKVVLAGGTTLGVVAFCSVPWLATRLLGFSLRPRLDHRHPAVRRIARLAGWAAVSLAMVQVLLATALVLGNGVEGGVVAFQVALTFFLLPYALVAIPLATAAFPDLSRRAQAGDLAGFADDVARAVRLMTLFLLPAVAAFVALGRPLARVALFGESAQAGVSMVAGTVAALAPGLVGYAVLLLAGRAFAALGSTRTHGLISVAMAVTGAVTMTVVFAAIDGDTRVVALGVGHSVAYTIAGVALLIALQRRTGQSLAARLGRPVGAQVAAAGAAAPAMWLVERALSTSGRPGALVELVVAGVTGAAVYVAVAWVGGGVRVADA